MKPYLLVKIKQQRLELICDNHIQRTYLISTAKNGPGQTANSECTPTGKHRIRAKIGADAPIYSVFIGRRSTGELYNEALAEQYPERDWILSRILWLSGLQRGHNRFGNVDSARRFIYIHGSPDHLVTGVPDSHGCIRMKNRDMIELFDLVKSGTEVVIKE